MYSSLETVRPSSAASTKNFTVNTYYPADLQWKDQQATTVAVRSRGSGSRSKDKPGLRVDFNRYKPDQRFLGLKSVALANAVQDPSMLRYRLAFTFFAKMGIPVSRAVHAKLYVNGNDMGLYQLVEAVDKVMLPRAFDDPKQNNKEDDGYLYEYVWHDAYQWTYLGSDLRAYADKFEAQTHETDAPADIYGRIEEMIRVINEARDSEFEQRASQYFDLDHLAAYLAVDSFLAQADGFLGDWGVNNVYLYQFENQKRWAFLLWDFTSGDNVYPFGTADLYQNCYAPTWGRHLWRTCTSPPATTTGTRARASTTSVNRPGCRAQRRPALDVLLRLVGHHRHEQQHPDDRGVRATRVAARRPGRVDQALRVMASGTTRCSPRRSTAVRRRCGTSGACCISTASTSSSTGTTTCTSGSCAADPNGAPSPAASVSSSSGPAAIRSTTARPTRRTARCSNKTLRRSEVDAEERQLRLGVRPVAGQSFRDIGSGQVRQGDRSVERQAVSRRRDSCATGPDPHLNAAA